MIDGSEVAELPPGCDFAVAGAPFDQGSSGLPGARLGPRAIRTADELWLVPDRQHLTLGVKPFEVLSVRDLGEVQPVPGRHEESLDALQRVATEILAAGAAPVVLGGDHSVAHAGLGALAEYHGAAGYGFLRLDAHSDVEASSVGRHHGNIVSRAVEQGWLLPEHSAVIGLRGSWGAAKDETDQWRERGMQAVTMDAVRRDGLDHSVRTVLDRLAVERIYLSIDIDVIDPAFAPGTGTPEPGGLTAEEAMATVRRIASTKEIAAIDLVEVSPPSDPTGITALTASRLLFEAFSAIARRRQPA